MNDEWRDADDPVADHEEEDRSPRPVSDLRFASSLLRAASVVSLALWMIAVVASMLFQLDQFNGIGQLGGPQPPSPVLAALAAGLNNTWGYLLVAVVAFAAAALLSGPDGSASRTSTVADDD